MEFKHIVNSIFKTQLGSYIKNVACKKNRCVITTHYFYPDRTSLEIIAKYEEPNKIKFTDEGKLFELITDDEYIRYSGNGMNKMNIMLAFTRDVQRHFYIDPTIPECYTFGFIEENKEFQEDIIRAFYHLMAICLIIGHLNPNVEIANDAPE